MKKRILNAFLILISVIFLGLGITYSVCPVIPFVEYRKYLIYYDYASDSDQLKETDTYYIFNLNNIYELYSTAYNTQSLGVCGIFKKHNSELHLFAAAPNTIDFGSNYKISFNKRQLKDEGSNVVLETTAFNPTFIFYLVSVLSVAGLIGVNYKWISGKLKKKKADTIE